MFSLNNLIPNFLRPTRILTCVRTIFTTPEYIMHFLLFNSPVIYTLYNNTFDTSIFLFSYLGCGILQGTINSILYHISDIVFYGKEIDIQKWKNTIFYDLVIYNSDSTYLYSLGAIAYSSFTIVPKKMQWTLIFPGYSKIFLQLFYLFILHDVFFTFIHYLVHKIKKFRTLHLKWHHECPFDIGTSRCSVATEGFEGLLRDIYSAVIPTYIIGLFTGGFYGYSWIFYYSVYSFWAMYIHTGVNLYHQLHHTENSSRNYGLYYMSDYILGTLDLESKKIK